MNCIFLPDIMLSVYNDIMILIILFPYTFLQAFCLTSAFTYFIACLSSEVLMQKSSNPIVETLLNHKRESVDVITYLTQSSESLSV